MMCSFAVCPSSKRESVEESSSHVLVSSCLLDGMCCGMREERAEKTLEERLG